MRIAPTDLQAAMVLVPALAAAAVVDLRSRRIPNVVSLFIFSTGLIHGAMQGGAVGAGLSLAGAAAGLALLIFPFSRGWMGGGDVKLLAAIGAWAGPRGVVSALLIGSVLGGILSLVALFRLKRADRLQVTYNVAAAISMQGLAVAEPARISRERGIPFGVALAASGAFIVWTGVTL